MNFREELFTQ